MREKYITITGMNHYYGMKPFSIGKRIKCIYHWFDGRNLPNIDNLYALSELFHLPVDALLVGNRKFECRCQSIMYQHVYLYYEKIMELKAG